MPTSIEKSNAAEVMSMPDIFSSVRVSKSLQFRRRHLVFVGPGILISVGYMDPETGQPIWLAALVTFMQLSFAVYPLLIIASDRSRMGPFVNRHWVKFLSYTVAVLIAGLNLWLLIQTFRGQ